MAIEGINWRPDRKTLAEFSEYWLFFLGMVACPLALVRGHWQLALGWWALAVVGRVVGIVRPELLRPLFVGLCAVTWPIGWVLSNVVLGVVYYLVFTPVAIVFRLLGRDAMKRRFDPDVPSYWTPSRAQADVKRYLRQF